MLVGRAGQAMKNAGSRRRFPIHSELIRLGFVQYALSAKGRDSIFDKLPPDVVGDESGNWSKWFGGYLRKKAGVTRHSSGDAPQDRGAGQQRTSRVLA
jgi:hypothetical protein